MAMMKGHEPGTISWVDLQAPDSKVARAFYGELLGWSFVEDDDTKTGYSMAQVSGRNVAGIMKKEPGSPGPAMWCIYFATADADATAAKVKAAGGQVLVPPMDVHDFGRMALFADSAGAHFGAWQPRRHTGAELVGEPGAMGWHEVYTRDTKTSGDFYRQVFGLEARSLGDPKMDYSTLHLGKEEPVAGIMNMTGHLPAAVPPHWTVYFVVDDTDAAVKKVSALRGEVVKPPFDTPYGRIAVVKDPAGAVFMLNRPPRRN